MNIYEKLQTARIKFLESNIKKTGKNKFSNFDYFELSDILPTLNKIMNELKMTSIISYNLETADLTLVNCENPEEKILFNTPLADASLKGATPIQSLGAQQTYIRRYLYLTAFDIIELDSLDVNVNNPEQSKSLEDYKKDYDSCKSVSDFTKVKNEYLSKLKDKTTIQELNKYGEKKFNELDK
jgi:hypothetical protein